MLFLSILHHYLLWHYTRAFAEIWHIWSNLLWFVFHFFSLPQMINSYLSPWKRMTEERGQTFNFEDLAAFVIINMISRIIGVMLRTTIILSGITALLLLCLAFLVTYVFWLFAPVLLIASVYYGLVLIFS